MTKNEKKKLAKNRVALLTERSIRAKNEDNRFMALVYLEELEAVLHFMKINQLIDSKDYYSSMIYCLNSITSLYRQGE